MNIHKVSSTILLILFFASPQAYSVDGAVLYTRGTVFGGTGTLRLVELGGATADLDTNVQAAVFSPDGRRIIYAHWNGSSWELVRMNRDGSARTVLTSGLGEFISISWRAPNRVIFTQNKAQQLWEINPDTGDVAIFYTTAAGNDFWTVSVSTDLTRMTFYSRLATRGIWQADIPNHIEAFVDPGCGNAMSPDGSKTTNNLDTHQDMYIRNWDRSVYKSLSISSTGEYWNDHRWSRNSNQWIIYSRGPEFYLQGYSNVYLRNIDTDEEIQVTNGSHDTHRDFWVGTLAQDPVITLNPQSLTFEAEEQGNNPPAQDVAIGNSGGGTLDSITTNHDASWLTMTKNGTGNSQVLSNHIDITGLVPDTYTATVTVAAPNAPQSASYSVTLTVTPKHQGDNKPPLVDAGPDQTIDFGQTASLDGTVTDDGLPAGGNLFIQWSKTSGPGLVTFLNPNEGLTDVTLAMAGTYVLTLTANDGELEASDDVTVIVNEGQEPSVNLIEPNGGERWETGSVQHIRWGVTEVSDVTIRYSTDNGASWEIISPSVDNKASDWLDYQWTVPNNPTDQALVRISDYFEENIGDQSDTVFVICSPGKCGSSDAGTNPDGGGSMPEDLELQGGCSCSFGDTRAGYFWLGLCLLLIYQKRKRHHFGSSEQ